jgi:hypothetical protein
VVIKPDLESIVLEVGNGLVGDLQTHVAGIQPGAYDDALKASLCMRLAAYCADQDPNMRVRDAVPPEVFESILEEAEEEAAELMSRRRSADDGHVGRIALGGSLWITDAGTAIVDDRGYDGEKLVKQSQGRVGRLARDKPPRAGQPPLNCAAQPSRRDTADMKVPPSLWLPL